MLFTPEQKEKINQSMSAAKTTAWKTVKYGSVFGTGVLTGTIIGIVVFLYISNDPD